MLRTLPLALLLLPVAAFARDWNVDASKSTLGFKGSYQKEAFDGAFRKFDVTVDLASADTGSAERDDSLKGGDFFAVSKFPKAHFTTESFAKGADGSVTAQGKLTIRDQTKPVTLKVTFAETGNAATLDVATVLKRADFGLGAGSDWTDVGADVSVHGHLVLTGK